MDTSSRCMNLHRDGHQLVVFLQDHVFPPRCIKTNLPTVAPDNATTIKGSPVALKIPLSSEWLDVRRRTTAYGWLLIIGGILACISATVCYVVAMLNGATEDQVRWLMFFILGGPLASIGGGVSLMFKHKPIVTVTRTSNGHLWLDGVHPDFLAGLPEWNQSTVVPAEVASEQLVADEQLTPDSFESSILAELEILRNPKTSWTQMIMLLLISLVLFVGLGMRNQPVAFILTIVGALFFHELGHYVGMRIFGYRNVRMFFIPFLGAAVSGHRTNAKSYQEAIVSLLGPLPGLLVAAALFGLAMVPTIDKGVRFELLRISILLGLLNGFNLLPIYPLDGGRFLNGVLFARNRFMESTFRMLAAAALIAYGASQGGVFLLILGIWMLMTVGATYKINTIAQHSAQSFGTALPSFDNAIPMPLFRAVVEQIRLRLPAFKTPKNIANVVFQVWEKMHVQPPGAVATTVLLMVYFFAMLLALPVVLIFFLPQK